MRTPAAAHPPPDALDEFEGLLRRLAPGATPDRVAATRWSHCRDALLADCREALPGFVVQCTSVGKYRDFITLYAPSVDERVAFVEAAMAPVRAARGGGAAGGARWSF